MSSLKRLGHHEICNRMHSKLPEVTLEVCRPEDVKDGLRTTRYEGLEEVGGGGISKKGSEIVASFGCDRWVFICVARLKSVGLREILAYGLWISSRPRHGP